MFDWCLYAVDACKAQKIRVTVAVSTVVEPAVTADRDAIRALLEASSLPVADLAAAPIRFWVARRGQRVIGTVGLERFGAAGLLRSLAVAPDLQGRGIGRELVEVLERQSLAAGVKLLVVLTQTAQPIFECWGYAAVDRAYVPEDVKQSAEFTTLCPASAVCLAKSLPGAGPVVA